MLSEHESEGVAALGLGTAVWLPHLEQAGSVLGTQRNSVPRVAGSGGRVDGWLQVRERARQIGFLKGQADCHAGEMVSNL